ncbi:reverse transcriptase-like protein [Novosphingobium sp. BL-8A]|uniref:ribonuclease HI n=1 Tax=Novosphingobium sp. BL-8A TaxID=3127639 RepID=UPI0037573511
MAGRRVKVFFDGGCRPNPGHIEVAVVVRGTTHLFDDLGEGTNRDAEWLALIHAMKVAQTLGPCDVELIGDALEIVRHANAALSSSKAAPGHPTTFLDLTKEIRPARIRWIKREQNLAGIALSRRRPR